MENKFTLSVAIILLSAWSLSLDAQGTTTVVSGTSFSVNSGTNVSFAGSVSNAGTISNSGILNVPGNWSNTGTSAVGGTVNLSSSGLNVSGQTNFSNTSLDGSSAQVVTDANAATTPSDFGNLTVSNSNGVTLGSNLYASQSLGVGSNLLTTTSLYSMELGTGATTSNTTGYVLGNLQKSFNTGSQTFNFIVGTTNGYSPASIAFNNVTTAGNLTVGATQSFEPHPIISATNEELDRYWTLTAGGGLAYNNYNATLNYLAADFNGSPFNQATMEATMRGAGYTSTSIFPTVGTRFFSDGPTGSIQLTGLTAVGTLTTVEPCAGMSAPTSNGNPSVCGNGSVTFSVSDPGAGFTIQWSTDGSTNNDGSGAGGSGPVTITHTVTVGSPVSEYARIYNNSTACTSPWTSAMTGTANALPAITPGSNPTVCISTTSASLDYSGATNSPNEYSIVWGSTAVTAGFTNVSNAALPASPITIAVPGAAPANTYAGTLSVANSSTGCASSNYSISVTSQICSTTWVGGAVSAPTDWFTGTNWNPAIVPNACAANIVIPTGLSNYPVISSASANVGNVDIGAGATITLTGQTLSVCGYWNGSGTSTSAQVTGNGTLIMNGSSAQTISGNTQFNILQIDNSTGIIASRSAIVSISTGLQLASGTLDVSVATLHLLSTASNNNSYIDDFSFGANPGSITGDIIADRYIPVSGLNQHYISSPLNTVGLSEIGASGPDGAYVIPTATCDETVSAGNSPYGTVFTYVDGHQPSGACMLGNWRITTAGNMVAAKGYSAYLTGNSTLSVTGPVNSGNMSIPNFNSAYPAVPTLQQTADGGNGAIESGWALVGNPYPSALDLTDLTDRVAAGFDAQVQVWKTSGPFSGSWQATTITGESGVVVIPPFQAFMVHVTTGKGQGNYSYPLYENERTRTTNIPFYRTPSQNTLQLILNYNGIEDVTTVLFNPSATNGFDAAYDANKQDGSAGNPTLYTFFPNATTWYSINTVPSLTQTAVVPMGLRPNNTGTMTISPEGIESFDPTTYILLEDKQTGNWQNMRNGTYTFTTTPTDNQQRFVLHFSPPAQITTSDASCNMDGLISIEQPGTANWNYSVTDVNNAVLSAGVLNEYSPVNVSVPLGVYQLTLTDNDGYTVVKNIQVSGFQQVMASFTINATTAQALQAIQFTSTSSGNICSWDFGDGASATGTTVSHSYQNEGVYTVTLSVANAEGCTSFAIQAITITRGAATGIVNLAGDALNIWSYNNTVFVDFSKMSNVNAEVQLYNVLGQTLSDERFGKSTIYSKELTNLDAAYIIVKVINDDQITTKKVFIGNVNR